VIFIPGLGNTVHVYAGFAGRFTARHPVVAVTTWGFGASLPNDRGAPLDTIRSRTAPATTCRIGIAWADRLGSRPTVSGPGWSGALERISLQCAHWCGVSRSSWSPGRAIWSSSSHPRRLRRRCAAFSTDHDWSHAV